MLTCVQVVFAERRANRMAIISYVFHQEAKARPERVVTKHGVIGKRSIRKMDNV